MCVCVFVLVCICTCACVCNSYIPDNAYYVTCTIPFTNSHQPSSTSHDLIPCTEEVNTYVCICAFLYIYTHATATGTFSDCVEIMLYYSDMLL